MLDKFRIISWKVSLKSALMQAFLSAFFCIIYTYIILILTGGEEFIDKADSYEKINGIQYDAVLLICGIMASLIPILLLRYNSIKYLLLFIPISILFYIVLMLLCVFFFIDDNFDLISYALSSVPIGSAVGTLVAIIFNLLKTKYFKI